MAKSKGKSKKPEASTTTSDATSYITVTQAEYDQMMLAYNQGLQTTPTYMTDAAGTGSSTAGNTPAAPLSHGGVIKNKSIKSNDSIQLSGPMEVEGSVKSNGSLTFLGDFSIRDKTEAYGNIDLDGNMTCQDKVKAFGNVKINGSALCRSKVKIFGKLKVTGNLEVTDTLEVWGAVTIQGYLKCKTLIAYASVTTVGDDSTYEVEDGEQVWGAKMITRNDMDYTA